MQQEIIHTFAVCAYKDSPYLEECLRSVTSQTVKSEVICCTSTPSSYIRELAARYQVPLYVRDGASNIREDWMFAYGKAQGRFVTIAHQDDRYRSDYAEKLLKAWKKYPDLLLFASDYLTIRMTEKEGEMKAIPEPFNMVWLVKKILRLPLRFHFLADRHRQTALHDLAVSRAALGNLVEVSFLLHLMGIDQLRETLGVFKIPRVALGKGEIRERFPRHGIRQTAQNEQNENLYIQLFLKVLISFHRNLSSYLYIASLSLFPKGVNRHIGAARA